MYIYKTTNLINGKIYIGQNSTNDEKYLGSGSILQLAIKKYGKENFKKEILEDNINDYDTLNEREKFWIKELKSQDKNIGYNILSGGRNCLTNFNNQERLKFGESRKGEKNGMYGKSVYKRWEELYDEETVRQLIYNHSKNISESNKGHNYNKFKNKGYLEVYIEELGLEEGTKKFNDFSKKMSISNSGENNGMLNHQHTEEAINKMKNHIKTKEHREKISKSKKGQEPWNKGKTGLQNGEKNGMFGRCSYDIWVEKYGIDEANRRKQIQKEKQIETNRLKIEKNPNYKKKTNFEVWVEKYGEEGAIKRSAEQYEKRRLSMEAKKQINTNV